MVLDPTKKILSKLPQEEPYALAKRARTERAPGKLDACKDVTISTIRHIIRTSLSYGRTEARKLIIDGFMFLVDKIKTFGKTGRIRSAAHRKDV